MKSWFKMIGLFVLIVLIVGGVWGYKTFTFVSQMKKAGTPKMVVSALYAEKSTWQGKINAVGSLVAVQGADLSFEANGIVESVLVSQSSPVKKGAIIATLKADEERAQLASLKATADLASANHQRNIEQYREGAISQAQMDQSTASHLSAQAAYAQMQATINKKMIRAPFSGQLGIVYPSVGAWVLAGTRVATLQDLTTLYVDFSLPQSLLTKVHIGDGVSIESEAFPHKTFGGKIHALDSRLDADTRTIWVRAKILNNDHLLLPGLMAKVSVRENAEQSWITLPQTAVVYSPYGDSVFKVTTAQKLYEFNVDKAKKTGADEKALAMIKKPENPEQLVAQQVFIETGGRRGDQIAVMAGVNVGDQVITSGQLKLKNGTEIAINNKVQPANEAQPSLAPQE